MALAVIGTAGAAIMGASAVQKVELLSPSNAKGIVVLRATFPDKGPLHSFAFEISADGVTFTEAQAGPTRGLRFAEAMIPKYEPNRQVVVAVPVVGRFDLTPQGFLFPTAGTYYLRWDVELHDRPADSLKLDQTIRLQAPRKDDLDFIRRIGNADFVRATFGVEPRAVMDGESIALGLVAELLKHAQSDPAEEGPWEIKTNGADGLMVLVRDLPESSYAPYAAYYAGGVYRVHLSQLPAFRDINPAAREHALYQKADEAFRFVVEHGDEFLKPRAFCCLAHLHLSTGAFGEAEGDLRKAAEESGGQGVIEDVIKRTRADITRTQAEPGKSGHRPDAPKP